MIPKALIFDVFGTCVDWRSSVAGLVEKHLPTCDGFAFADAWRGEYQPAMKRIRDGGRGYVALDDLHLENLDRVLRHFDIQVDDRPALNTAWEKLDPWPDVVPGLMAIKDKAIIAPCSNGSIALMTRLARYAKLPWDCILGAEIAQDYKPKPAVYLASCAALRLEPAQVMMVAAHNDDLHAARAAGLMTAFVARPKEHGPDQTTDLTPDANWDIVAQDFLDLAAQI
ncbi:haloacid dehalogenase type II [Parasulfitobacter algicola]|uniref:(S)-2-haloacid dehalogenase n=1 Tax=Parasulfitobacter algicola TaxID=2614809 RepID=A0ABX2IMC6_9RHOB|nr:haloacid dehalogenase type II [Sulfitobacter algicola]NSX53495.1 haloacid dehalogenase type II [Sulfitobacter algicola]